MQVRNTVKYVKVLFCAILSDIQKNFALFEGSQASPTCPSDKSGIEIEMRKKHWWIDTETGKSILREEPVRLPRFPPQISHGEALAGRL